MGKKSEFGSKEGLKASKLRKYHYMIMMPYFTDQVKLATYGSQEEAVKAVEANLTTHKGGTVKVYRVDLSDKKESVFGIGLSEGDGADAKVMKVVDMGELRRYLPTFPMRSWCPTVQFTCFMESSASLWISLISRWGRL